MGVRGQARSSLAQASSYHWYATVLRSSSKHLTFVSSTGDLNSLLQSDYSRDEWARIAALRQRSNWEAPQSKLVESILQRGYQDTRAMAAVTYGPLSTCR